MTPVSTLLVFVSALGCSLSLHAAANSRAFVVRRPSLSEKSPSQQVQKQAPGDLYRRIVKKYPTQLSSIDGREYKTMLKTGNADGPIDETLTDLWDQIKTAANQGGYALVPTEEPHKLETSTKEYFDTKDKDLWRAGYLIRVSTKILNDIPDTKVTVTVKSIKERPLETLKTKLRIPPKIIDHYQLTHKKETQENISFFPSGMLDGYVEKGVSFSIEAKELGNRSLNDFAKFVPELLEINKKIDTKTSLKSSKAYAARIVPGSIKFPDLGESPVYIEAWSKSQGEKPFVIDFSFGYETPEYYHSEDIQTAGEEFMLTVVRNGLEALIDKDSAKFGGSKVRLMMNRPIRDSKKSDQAKLR
ncbi:MAG: hypothetical protein JNM39_14570 [Bdellovibrionaceae bacterium]|nr:hypothetical protein [Pseudobdellovibrionaceae bacterium]